MKRKSVRLAVVALVAAMSVAGLSQSPASAKTGHHHSSARTVWCC
jgi:hypothetical protein